MSASAFLGTRRLFLFLCATGTNRISETSVLRSSGQSHALLLLIRSFASKSVMKSEEKGTCFTVSYLRDKCGLSLESAKYVSKHVKLENPERADSIINMLKEHGFTSAHISKFIKWQPFLLGTNAEERILPKLEFFRSVGCSNADIVTIFSRNPVLLMHSLEKRIIPCYDIMKSLLLTDSEVIKAFKYVFYRCSLDPAILALNIQEMRDHELPNSSISVVVRCFHHILFQKPSKFSENLNEVKHMGFDPAKFYFVLAMRVLSVMSKLTLQSKLNVLERFGLSKENAWSIFCKQPMVMHFSEEKIIKVTDFVLNKMRRKPQHIVQYPQVFMLSLEKRIIPRYSVAQVLVSKGLRKEISLSSLLRPVEKKFLKNYVTKYQGTVPELLDIYKGKIIRERHRFKTFGLPVVLEFEGIHE